MLSLGLGIGANTAIFSLIDAVLLRTLPVENPHELFFLAHDSAEVPSTSSNYPSTNAIERRRSSAASPAYRTSLLKVHSGESIELVQGQYVSGNYHAIVQAPMLRGRGFVNESDRPGDAPVAVISESYWARKFGRAPDVLEKTVSIRGTPVPIVGVTAAGFTGLVPGAPAEITLPLAMFVADRPEYLEQHDTFTGMPILARLRPGVPEAQALAVADAIFQQYMSEPENSWARKGRADQYDVARLLPAAKGWQPPSPRVRRVVAGADGAGGTRVVDRVGERRQPAAGPVGGARQGDRNPAVRRRRPRAPDSPVSDREHPAGHCGCVGWDLDGVMGH